MNKVNNGNVRLGEWKAIKALLDNNLSVGQVARMVGRSWNTVKNIELSESYSEYREQNHERSLKVAEARAAKVKPVNVEAEDSSEPNSSEPSETTKVMDLVTREVWALESIAKSLAVLVSKQ